MRDDTQARNAWAHRRGHHFASAAPHRVPEGDDTLQLAFRNMLERLCMLTKVPPEDRAELVAHAAMTLNGTRVAFQLEEWSGFVKVYIDVGQPAPASAPALYRHLLEQMLYLPAPFSMVPGLHPVSRQIVLCACAPLAADEAADAGFVAFLEACLRAAAALVHGA